MIFGDPYKFAVLIEKVPEWTTPGSSYVNGLFHFIIDGMLLPDSICSATLGGDIYRLSDSANALINPPCDKLLFDMPKKQAFETMMNVMLPEVLNPDVDVPDDFVTDYKYLASTYNLEANHCYVFAVSFRNKIRVLGAKTACLSGNDTDGYQWNDVDELNVYEACLSKKCILELVNAVKSQAQAIISNS